MGRIPDDQDDGKPGCHPRLLSQHLADLRASGLSDAQIEACEFYSESDPKRVQELLRWKHSAAKLGACLCFPFRDRDGHETGQVMVKPDNPRSTHGKKIKYESPIGMSLRVFIPPNTRTMLADSSVPLLVTEGMKKAAKADQDGLPCLGLGGVYGWQQKRPTGLNGKKTGVRELIPDLATISWKGRRVYIAFDSDLADNTDVQWAEWHLAETLRSVGADVLVIRLPGGSDGRKVGLDDYLVDQGRDELRRLMASATAPTRPAPDDCPTIIIGTDEHRVNAEAVAALGTEPDLYQRGGMLVRVMRSEPDADADAAVRRPPGSPVVRDLAPPLLRDRLTRCAQWMAVKREGDGSESLVPAHPPGWAVNAVHARGDWPSVRHLEAVINHPVILSDGSILNGQGYDRRSRLLVSIPDDLSISVPDRPSREDILAAVATLDDVLTDFPFERLEHRATWLAGLLTPLAWFAFDGPAPMTLFDGNVRGVGKGLLGDVIALILTGRRFPVMSYTSDKEELRKKITSLAMEGERLVLLDNLAGAVGNDVLDMALTADRWKDRVLGGNRVYDGPLHVCWFATGNNVQLNADTARRCSHCRLETSEERPELLSKFKYSDLRTHIRNHRSRLLSAALTILRGWFTAGKPTHGLKPWGSYEGWSALVREAVVFAGLPDPGETRLALQTLADRDAITMSALIDALARMDPSGRGVTTAEIVDTIRKPPFPTPDWLPDLKSAVEELCGRLDGRMLGYRFRSFARRNFGGRMIDRASSAHGTIRWAVFSSSTFSRSGSSPLSPPSPPKNGPVSGGDGGDGGHVPAQDKSEQDRRSQNNMPHQPRRRFGNNDKPFEWR
jgi:hypothetical protein